ncbi:glycosyltransferase [Rheinheimera sp. UJ51]|uniref:glycosyltransferase family 2 protein n=1 Tax=Rheinheimera sp. UJ51 TaxID=2892446 RepID=UPI001E5CC2A1|nr:glycosyltransferase family A protein [Rheinheimera sp. UJ51]MCC5450492.1 glycosyltransferase [Rheinheimera sp. UJ51]
MKINLTVLIPVYNAGLYLSQAIASILSQSYQDFKLIILDDCSTDDSYSLAQKFADLDSRITLLRNDHNTGIASARDKLLNLVQTQYFAWMDADDIALPDRFQSQIDLLERKTEVVAVSGGYIDMASSVIHLPEIDSKRIATQMLICNAIVNPGAMVRTYAARRTGFSFESCGVKSATDFAFWLSLISIGPIENLPKALVMYRVHELQESTANRSTQSSSAKYLVAKHMQNIGIENALSVVDDIILLPGEKPSLNSPENVGQVYKALLLIVANDNRYDHAYLNNLLEGLYMRYCKFFGLSGFYSYVRYFGFFGLIKKKKFGFSFLKRCLDFNL